MALLDADFLHKLEYLALVSRRVYRGHLLAHRSTRQLGSGLDFADHQPYAPGDDFRYLDWNAFARHGELLLKRFHEERDLRVDLMVDCSRSMAWGEPMSKFDYARRIAACLAYVALAQLDQVALTAFADKPDASWPVTRGKAQMSGFLQRIEALQSSGDDTHLEAAAVSLTQRNRAGGLAIVISDFLDRRGFQRALDRLRYHQFEIYLLHVVHADEQEPVMRGDCELRDVETGETRRVTIRERDVQRYRQAYGQFVESLQTYARRHALGYLGCPTDLPCEELILRTMRRVGWLSGATA